VRSQGPNLAASTLVIPAGKVDLPDLWSEPLVARNALTRCRAASLRRSRSSQHQNTSALVVALWHEVVLLGEQLVARKLLPFNEHVATRVANSASIDPGSKPVSLWLRHQRYLVGAPRVTTG